MGSLNKITIIGNLGADPEVRYTQGGQPVANLRIATTEQWNDKDGAKQERTEWHAVSVWGKQAEVCGQYLAKGRQVYVEGRLQSREFTDKEGVNRNVWEIQGDKVVFLGSGKGDGDGASGGAGGSQGWGGGNKSGGGGNDGNRGGNTGGGQSGGDGWGGNSGGGGRGRDGDDAPF